MKVQFQQKQNKSENIEDQSKFVIYHESNYLVTDLQYLYHDTQTITGHVVFLELVDLF